MRRIDARSLIGRPEWVTYGLLREELEASIGMRACNFRVWNVSPMIGILAGYVPLAQQQPVGTEDLPRRRRSLAGGRSRATSMARSRISARACAPGTPSRRSMCRASSSPPIAFWPRRRPHLRSTFRREQTPLRRSGRRTSASLRTRSRPRFVVIATTWPTSICRPRGRTSRSPPIQMAPRATPHRFADTQR